MILQGNLDPNVAFFAREMNWRLVESAPILVQMLDKIDYPSLVVILLLSIGAQIFNTDSKTWVQVGKFTEPLRKDFEAKIGRLKNPRVGFEGNFRPPLPRLPRLLKLGYRKPKLVAL